ncbi:MAG: type II CRISPR-associated endonuclease Cas1 [Phycisphaera sp.]|nr:type II CRISPR-associated endonuclease Cas1 [Phycisphaera sp.]
MIKRTIEISRQPVLLSARLDQLIVQPYDEPKDAARSIPCEDIGYVIVDEPRCSFTQGAAEALLRHGALLVICGRDHLPAGVLLPLSANVEQVHRLQEQIAVKKPTLKRLWQQIVRAKIANQALNILKDSPARRKLTVLGREVKSGDTANTEAQAARVYWAALRATRKPMSNFKRNPEGTDIANILLNYGYAVARAAVARALVSAGLHPALGIHHHNRANAFCLADDLVEPIRPMVDRRALHLLDSGTRTIDQPAKAHLLHVLSDTVTVGDQTGPLMVGLHRVTASLTRCYQNQDAALELPIPLEDER